MYTSTGTEDMVQILPGPKIQCKALLRHKKRKQKKTRTVNIPDSAWSLLKNDNEDCNDNTIYINKLMRCLKKLKPHEVTLIEMRFFEDRAFKEIGEILKIKSKSKSLKLIENCPFEGLGVTCIEEIFSSSRLARRSTIDKSSK